MPDPFPAKRFGKGSGYARLVLRGLFVIVAEHVGEGKYRTVSAVDQGKAGMEECAICCMESLKKKG